MPPLRQNDLRSALDRVVKMQCRPQMWTERPEDRGLRPPWVENRKYVSHSLGAAMVQFVEPADR